MRRLITTIAVVMMAIGVTAPAQAERRLTCGPGEVNAAFQALPVGFHIVNEQGSNNKMAGLGGAIAACQYRVFFDGATFTFREGEPFVGGIIWLNEYKDLGISRQEAIADINTIVDTVTLNKVGDPPVEQDLMSSAFKNFEHPQLGQTVYQSRGFITELEVGTYESLWVASISGVPIASAEVTIEIIP